MEKSTNWFDQLCKGLLDACGIADIPNRIILIGAHGTGKSTLASALAKELNAKVVESVAREFFKDWKRIEDVGLLDPRMPATVTAKIKQHILCSQSRWDFMRWIDVEEPIIMTRCPLDTIAYGMADFHVDNEAIMEDLDVLVNDEGFCKAIKESLFVYLPIEFGIENDGVRPVDIQYQRDVDGCMRVLMHTFGIVPLVVSGTVEERIQKILEHLAGK